jgi:U3 small nucleolar RNA-associated protein 20
MLEIENTPRTVENIRSTSLAMRKLTALSTVETDPFLIAFCFGLLTVNFAPLWSDACAVLKAVADRSGAKLWEKAFADLNVEDNEEDNRSDSKSMKPNLAGLADGIWDNHQLEVTIRRQSLRNKVPSPLFSR